MAFVQKYHLTHSDDGAHDHAIPNVPHFGTTIVKVHRPTVVALTHHPIVNVSIKQEDNTANPALATGTSNALDIENRFDPKVGKDVTITLTSDVGQTADVTVIYSPRHDFPKQYHLATPAGFPAWVKKWVRL